MYVKVDRDTTIQIKPVKNLLVFNKPYEIVVDDNWSEIVIGADLRGLIELKDCLEEFINEETGRGQSGPNSAPNRLPA